MKVISENTPIPRNYLTYTDITYRASKGCYATEMCLDNEVTLRVFHRGNGKTTAVLHSVNKNKMYLNGNTTGLYLHDVSVTTTGIDTTTMTSKGTGLVDVYVVVMGNTIKNTSRESMEDIRNVSNVV